jgi:high-affinity K+ transport system ATPase subunit B
MSAENDLMQKLMISKQIMEKHNNTTLLVMQDGKYKGIVHLHDILKEGIF